MRHCNKNPIHWIMCWMVRKLSVNKISWLIYYGLSRNYHGWKFLFERNQRNSDDVWLFQSYCLVLTLSSKSEMLIFWESETWELFSPLHCDINIWQWNRKLHINITHERNKNLLWCIKHNSRGMPNIKPWVSNMRKNSKLH